MVLTTSSLLVCHSAYRGIQSKECPSMNLFFCFHFPVYHTLYLILVGGSAIIHASNSLFCFCVRCSPAPVRMGPTCQHIVQFRVGGSLRKFAPTMSQVDKDGIEQYPTTTSRTVRVSPVHVGVVRRKRCLVPLLVCVAQAYT